MATPPNTSLSRLGQVNQAGSTDALFLKQFGGEILTEFKAEHTPRAQSLPRLIAPL